MSLENRLKRLESHGSAERERDEGGAALKVLERMSWGKLDALEDALVRREAGEEPTEGDRTILARVKLLHAEEVKGGR